MEGGHPSLDQSETREADGDHRFVEVEAHVIDVLERFEVQRRETGRAHRKRPGRPETARHALVSMVSWTITEGANLGARSLSLGSG